MSKEREFHADGSYTDRYSDGQSVTCESDGTVRESTKTENHSALSGFPVLELFEDPVNYSVTRDGDGNIINMQREK
jgi:hypothetical protein